MAQPNTPLTLGSLFDGSGGFPLAGILAGITPVWASEIEPFCMPTGLLPNLNEIVLRIGYVLFIVDAEDVILSELIAHMPRPT